MAKHFYTVIGEVCLSFQDAMVVQSRIERETGEKPRIMEHFEDGAILPHPHGFEQPQNVIGTAADELQRMADEEWNQ